MIRQALSALPGRMSVGLAALARWAAANIQDISALVLLVFIGIKFTSTMPRFLDITLWDEAGYLFRGLELRRQGLAPAEVAPLYSAWYYALSRLSPKSVALFFLNYRLTTLLPPILFFLVLRRAMVSTIGAMLAAVVLLICDFNALTTPRVNHFALMVALATLGCACLPRSFAWAGVVASLGSLAAAYVRPEYFMAYAAFSAIFVAAWLRDGMKRRRLTWTPMLVLGLASAALILLFGSPISGSGGRGFVAFGQHFSINWVRWNQGGLHPFFDWERIVATSFPESHTVLGAVVSEPALVLKHVWTNLVSFIGMIPKLTALNSVRDPLTWTLVGALSLCLGWPVLPRLRLRPRAGGRLLLLIAVFLIPGAFAMLMIHPRVHYLLVPCVLGCVGILAWLHGGLDAPPRSSFRHVLICGLFSLTLVPYFTTPQKQRPVYETIRQVRSLKPTTAVRVLVADAGLTFHFGKNYEEVLHYTKPDATQFLKFLEDNKIGMVAASDELQGDWRYRDDPEWRAFFAEPEPRGFEKIPVSATSWSVLVRKSVLETAGAGKTRAAKDSP